MTLDFDQNAPFPDSGAGHAPRVFMYPGQGVQYYQMAKALFTTDACFRDCMADLDGVVTRLTGHSIVNVLYGPDHTSHDPFNELTLTHPAIFMIEYALTHRLAASAITPDYVLGYSLGEITALTVAGAISVNDALAIIVDQAAIIDKSCAPGGMLAVLDSPALFHTASELFEDLDLAAVNYDAHFVVSGHADAIAATEARLRHDDVLCQRIAVRHGFHSRVIDTARQELIESTVDMTVSEPQVPCLSSTKNGVITHLSDDHFWDVIRGRVHFQDLMRRVAEWGSMTFFDLGPSGTLALFAKRLLPTSSASQVITTISPFDKDTQRFERVLREQM